MEEIKVLKYDLIRHVRCITIRAASAAAFHPLRLNQMPGSAPILCVWVACLPVVRKDLYGKKFILKPREAAKKRAKKKCLPRLSQ